MRKLLAITIIGFILRIYLVSTIPPSLSWDEVSIGYNAYSIIKTGKDEHGKFFPLDAFTAYGDYKPPLSVYLTVPSVALFDLTEFAVRLPSVVFGTFTIVATYFFALTLIGSIPVAFLAACALAISPWHIQLSRGGFEANIAVFFIVLGAYLILRTKQHIRLAWVCFLPFVAAIYTFNSARYVVPFLGLGLMLYLWPTVRKHLLQFAAGAVVALVLLAPIIPHLVSKEARLRFVEVNIFSDASIVQTSNARIAYDNGSLLGKVFHNRRVGYARSYLTHFFDNIEPWFLFVRGDGNPKFSTQDVGQLYLIELPLLLYGIFVLMSKHTRAGWLLVFWVVASIIPAATARETPHALRIENSLPAWQIFIAAGISALLAHKSKITRIVVIGLIGLLYAGNFTYYLHNYYQHYPVEFSSEWQYGYREAIRTVGPIAKDYDEIVIGDGIGRPYMYTLFYTQTDPAHYLATKKSTFDAAGFYHVFGFDKFRFVQTETEFKKNTLYVLSPGYVPPEARVLETVHNLGGEPVLVIFDL